MLTEDQILDEQVQTLDEALDKLEEHSADPITPNEVDDTDVGQALTVTVECLKATVDLYHTIVQEGVSASDIKALRSIRKRMEPYMALPFKPALEAYEGLFTPNRSMINQVVSQEATMAELGTTLKEWFFKFVDFIIKVVDWCRVAWNSETAISLRLKAIDHNLQSMYNSFDDVYKRNLANGRDLTPELNKLAKLVLLDPKLPRHRATLIAFGQKNADMPILREDKEVDRLFTSLIRDITSLKDYISSNKTMAFGYDYATRISEAADQLDLLFVTSDEEDFLVNELWADYWKHPKRFVDRPIHAASRNIKQIQQIADVFRKIKRNSNFDQLKDIDTVVQVVENITGSTKALERIIRRKQELFTVYYKTSATMANFYIRGHAMMLDELVKNSTTDNEKVVIDKLSKSWEDLLNKMGI